MKIVRRRGTPFVTYFSESTFEQQRQRQQRQAALAMTVEEFCRNISPALDNPSFEMKQKILRLAVERDEFVEDQITIKHVIPISDVRLQRDQLSSTPMKMGRKSCIFIAGGEPGFMRAPMKMGRKSCIFIAGGEPGFMRALSICLSFPAAMRRRNM